MSSSIPERPTVEGNWEAWGAYVDAEVRKVIQLAARTLVKRVITAAYTLVPDDAVDRVLHCTSSSPITLTLPSGVPQEVAIPWRQAGPGQLTFSPANGVTLVARGGVSKSAGQWAGGVLTCISDNVWLLEGDLA